mmetsp:Transcript_69073/g.133341  ORF Transcript_69073/g.133341 Transcript_69073/m.133341 type:complete len:80 (-) Transcript_69073:39-278(-)
MYYRPQTLPVQHGRDALWVHVPNSHESNHGMHGLKWLSHDRLRWDRLQKIVEYALAGSCQYQQMVQRWMSWVGGNSLCS